MNRDQVPTEILQDWQLSSRREWLITNGIGGYGMGSVAGANTRRYHGLLVAATNPPLGRVVLLSRLEEEIRVEDEIYLLGSNKFPSVIYPQGFRHLIGFTHKPVPTFTYALHENSVVLQKQIWMEHGRNTVYARYLLLKAPEPIKFAMVPYMAYKDYHSEQRRWDGFRGLLDHRPSGGIGFTAYEGAIPLKLNVDPAQSFAFDPVSGWFYNYEHEREQERGLEFLEDLYCPGRYDGILAPGKGVTLTATIEKEAPRPSEEAYALEVERQQSLLESVQSGKLSPVLQDLVLAADQFVVDRSDRVTRATVIAGYPWFTDWGRDTMVALPGLCLSTRRFETARSILKSFSEAVQNGLIPNRFTDSGQGAEFNTIDATFWFINACYAYAKASDDWALLTGELLPVLEDIIERHRTGTLFDIHLDLDDGLLFGGHDGVQLTWMDAKVGDWVVTPRTGKPVEIQALWYNSLRIIAELSVKADRDPAWYESWARRAQESFLKRFVNPDNGCLYDVIDAPPNRSSDPSVRPNQIFALSLPFPIVDPASELAGKILDQVSAQLYEPYGLRTLAPGAPGYRAHYGPGDPNARDWAYHQGTAWPWLLGAYTEAYRAAKRQPAVGENPLNQLLESIGQYGIGTIGEVFDAENPFRPDGCIAQAWSVSEILRVLLNA